MSQRALDFAERWIGSNIHSNPFLENEDFSMDEEVRQHEERLLGDAEGVGIEAEEFDDIDLSDLIEQAVSDVYDPEIGGFKD